MTKSECQPADEVERLRERVLAYKGQVEAGAAEIATLKARVAELEAAPPPSTQKVLELLKRAQRTIERDYPNGQLAIDIRAALSTNPGEQE
jgi:hypothetical protein